MYRLFILFICLTSYCSLAQTTVKGTVTDNHQAPLPGVNIYLKDTYDGATSNVDGGYSFVTDEVGDQVLIFQSMGYRRIELPVTLNAGTMEFSAQMKEAINELTSVVITAGAIESSDESKAVMLKPLDVVTTPSAMGDVVGALQTLPGTSTVGNDGRLFVRGGDATETAIFIDGMMVGNSFGSTAANVPTRTRFNANLFKGSFFSTGGYSAEFGNALSSALSLNTVDMPLRSQGDISLLSVGGGYSHTLVGKVQSLTTSANYLDLSPYQSVVRQNFDWERSPYGWDTEVSYRRKMGKGGMIKAYARTEASGMKLWQPQPGDTQSTQVGLNNKYSYGQIALRQEGSNGWYYYGGLSMSHNRDNLSVSNIDVTTTNEVLHAKAVAVKDFSDAFSIKSGVEHLRFAYQESFPSFGLSRDFHDRQTVAFSEATYFVSNSLVLRAGGRAGYSNLIETVSVDPRMSIAYKLKNEGQLSLAVGRFHQPQGEMLRVLDNRLPNAVADHVILNYFLMKNGRTLRAEAFYKDYNSLATYHGGQWQYTHVMANGEGYARGFDLFFRDRISIKNTDIWVTYSFVDSKRQYAHHATLVQPSFAPRHNGSVVAKHFVRSLKSQIGASFVLNDGYTYADPNKASEWPATINSRTRSYQDLSLSWSYLPKPNLIIHFACSNVLGRENVFGYQYSSTPSSEGHFDRLPIGQTAPRFLLLGAFLTLSKDKSANQLNNL